MYFSTGFPDLFDLLHVHLLMMTTRRGCGTGVRARAAAVRSHGLFVVCLLVLPMTTHALHYPLNLAAAAALLDLRLPSPRATVRAAYRRKATLAHPDVVASESADAFIQLTAAYELLLQFGTCPASPPQRSPQSQPPPTSSYKAAERTAAPRTASTWSRPRPPPQPFAREPERMARRVQAWRVYWQFALIAAQATSEVEIKGAAREAAQREVSARLDELQAALARGPQAMSTGEVDVFRARYASATARLDDARCAFDAFAARARVLHEQAREQQELAQQIA